MDRALAQLRRDSPRDGLLPDFGALCSAAGFDDYFALERRYSAE